jgi:hypothetical protein
MKMKSIIIACLFIVLSQTGSGQVRDARLKTKGYVNPQEIVSLDSTMRMDQALNVINELSKQFSGKIIVDLEKRKTPIGVYIVNQHWRDALEMILARQGLTYVEEPDYIRVVQSGAGPTSDINLKGISPDEPPPKLEARDVKISAVFFTTDVTKLQNYGISWNFYRSKSSEPTLTAYNASGIALGDTASPVPPIAVGNGAQQVKPALDRALAIIQSPPEFKFANIDALIKFFGSNNLGEVITNPDIVVRNGKPGRIQVGKDIFVATRDIAGNTVNQMISTGTIIEVTPVVYTQSDTNFIYLNLIIEQSTASAGPEISRTQVKTHALLYDGEEAVIGGLVSTMDQVTREGVPILKDMPWWFFGFPYIFGSEEKTKTKTELIILLKAELTKPIRDRMIIRQSSQDLIDKKRAEYSKEFEKKQP